MRTDKIYAPKKCCAIVLKKPRISGVALQIVFFCNVIGGEIFLSRKKSTLMKPEAVSAECHQTSLVGGVWGQDYITPGPGVVQPTG